MANYDEIETGNSEAPDGAVRSFVENPFLVARFESNKTQASIAQMADVSPAFVMKIEQGLFRTVPRRIVEFYKDNLGLDENWVHQYRRFQLLTRRLAPRPMGRNRVVIFPDPFSFSSFRVINWPQLSKAGWCKAFCVHPSSLHSMENDPDRQILAKEIEIALIDSGAMNTSEMSKLKELIRTASLG